MIPSRLLALIAYYQDHLKWDQRTFHVVDWEVFGGVYWKCSMDAIF
jgi:hypothetical protein